MRPSNFALAAIALTSWMAPSVAEACSCLAGLVYSLPAADAVNVPLNPYIRLGYSFSEPRFFSLSDPAGDRIEVTPIFTNSGSVYEVGLELAEGLTLSPGTTYTVQVDGHPALSFTTGAEVDVTPPGLGGISSFAGGYDDGCTDGMCSSCGASAELRITYEGAADDLTPGGDLLYRVYVSKSGVPDSSSPSVILRGDWPLGYSFCLATYSDLAAGDTVTIRASTIDAAGLESPLSEPITTEVADDPDTGTGPGCTSGRSRVMTMGWMVFGLGVIPLVRRRRRV